MRRLLQQRLQRAGVSLAAPLLALSLVGCGAVGSSARQVAALRIVDAKPDAGALDLYANATALAYNLRFGTVTSYVVFTPGAYTLGAHAAGTGFTLTSARGSLLVDTQSTLLLGNVAAGLQSLLLQDQDHPAPLGQVAVRFVHQATRMGAVDLYLVPSGGSLAATAPVKTGLTFATAQNVPAYMNVPSGAYTLMILPSGIAPTSTAVASYTGTVVSYPSASARTVVLLDRPVAAAPALQVVTAVDYDGTAAS